MLSKDLSTRQWQCCQDKW